ncbi:MAG: hypothetical protein CME62_18320 [Halobacteriovoraceae bacterium]|nr:hypothetical protein [Halobacteriovoraceae bacterium]|tara:strand:- start:1504 stop:2295 length:792 start_codon:yes stop_codon:yes gene_type:complete
MNRFSKKLFLVFLTLTIPAWLSATILVPTLPEDGVVEKENQGLIDPDVDYTKFYGRVTDKDDTGRIIKVKTENNNSKFLKAGDVVHFKVNNHEDTRFCKASVRSVEDYYFSLYVQDFSGCWKDRYFPRGLQLNFESPLMAKRVFEASEYRKLLLLRKDGFLNQLNNINNFLWTFDQQKLKTAAEFDQRINELKRQKQIALDNILQKKQESLSLQTELVKKLDVIDESLDHYRVERREFLKDRWVMDNDTGLPFDRRPQVPKKP